ncbi:transporter substrate-binding domain-containing protein [Sphingomonas sp.]|uniref:transporter substrate-binding domain-containing protein n=1 Tax=Sphingomonas sp. TaxID=28214 RepID=UPI000DB572A1|nr:transporter substrate-binding domain-containing protein [Sphingomonas sp.]PZU09777.1 MAG: ABC transporter substrate-binding protein [Sphingomonas sp.]
MPTLLSRRRVLALAGGATVAAALPAIAAPLDRVIKNGFLSIAVYRDFEPWSWRDGDALKGIDIEVGELLASALALRASFTELIPGDDVAADLRNAVWRGSVVGQAPADVMMHVPIDRQLALANDRAVLIAPYYRESFTMACNREKQPDCEIAPTALKGSPLAAEIDTIPDFYLSSVGGGALRANVKHFPNGPLAVGAAAKGDADAVVATRAQIEHALLTDRERLVQRKGPLPMMLSPGWNVGLAVKDDSRDLGDKLESIVAALIANGKIPAIFERYGVVYRPAAES